MENEDGLDDIFSIVLVLFHSTLKMIIGLTDLVILLNYICHERDAIKNKKSQL